MSRITLLELLELPTTEIIARANSQERENTDVTEEDHIPIRLSDYRGLLSKEDIVVGKEFTLRNGHQVRILSVDVAKNSVLICFDKFQYYKKKLNLYKLMSDGKEEFNYQIGECWYYKKTNKSPEEIIEIRFLNPSQRAVGYIIDGTRKLIKVKKLTRRVGESV